MLYSKYLLQRNLGAEKGETRVLLASTTMAKRNDRPQPCIGMRACLSRARRSDKFLPVSFSLTTAPRLRLAPQLRGGRLVFFKQNKKKCKRSDKSVREVRERVGKVEKKNSSVASESRGDSILVSSSYPFRENEITL